MRWIQNRARLWIRGWRRPSGWTGADGRTGIGDRWRQRRNIHQPRHRAIERRRRIAVRLMMTRRRRVIIAVVAVIIVTGAVAATVIATSVVPIRIIIINRPAVVVIIVIIVVGEALIERRRGRRRRRCRSMMDVLNTRGIRKGILRGIRGRPFKKMQSRRWRQRLRLDLDR